MKKIFREQIFTFMDGSDMMIDVVVEDKSVIEIIAAECSRGFEIGDVININGEESLIRSEDIEIEFLN